MSRIGATWIIVFAVGALQTVAPAAAHSPYFTQTEKLVVPDGRMGEIRLLHGDGILRSDPIRAVVVDADGQVLARSPKSYAMVIACNAERRCKVYDLNHLSVSRPDPVTFHAAGPASNVEDLWMLERDRDAWGFTTRRMTLRDAIAGHAAYLMNRKFDAVLPLLFTGLAVTFVLGVLRPAPSTHPLTRVVWYVIGAAAFCIAGLLMLMSMLTLIVTGLPLQLWLALSTMAAVMVGFLFSWNRKRTVQRE